jgi:hypothetical protein
MHHTLQEEEAKEARGMLLLVPLLVLLMSLMVLWRLAPSTNGALHVRREL